VARWRGYEEVLGSGLVGKEEDDDMFWLVVWVRGEVA
jgi:hypothetical protein